MINCTQNLPEVWSPPSPSLSLKGNHVIGYLSESGCCFNKSKLTCIKHFLYPHHHANYYTYTQAQTHTCFGVLIIIPISRMRETEPRAWIILSTGIWIIFFTLNRQHLALKSWGDLKTLLMKSTHKLTLRKHSPIHLDMHTMIFTSAPVLKTNTEDRK